jgi:TrmH family RNA methyltransferase
MPGNICGVRHPQIRRIINLQKNRTHNKKNLFILEGLWAHKRLLHTDLKPEIFLYCPAVIYNDAVNYVSKHFAKISKMTIKISEKALCRIASRKKPDGILSVCQFPSYTFSHIKVKSENLVLVLDGLEKPGNIGTLMRSLNGVGGDGVFICNRRVRLIHPKIVKSSCGVILKMPVIESTPSDIYLWLLKNNFAIYLATCEKGKSADIFSKRTAIVLGNERYGISHTWYENEHTKITVPLKGHIDSYNVAVAGSIIMYEAAKSIFS